MTAGSIFPAAGERPVTFNDLNDALDLAAAKTFDAGRTEIANGLELLTAELIKVAAAKYGRCVNCGHPMPHNYSACLAASRSVEGEPAPGLQSGDEEKAATQFHYTPEPADDTEEGRCKYTDDRGRRCIFSDNWHTPHMPVAPADAHPWTDRTMITAGNGRHYRRNGKRWDRIDGGALGLTDDQLAALGPVRRAVVVTLPEEGHWGQMVNSAGQVWAAQAQTWSSPAFARRYAGQLLAAAIAAEEGQGR